MRPGSLNAYVCDRCGDHIVTVDRVDGTTPMFLACRSKGEPGESGNHCKGRMASMFYSQPPWPFPAEPTWEWFRPEGAELAALSEEMRDHVARGGLDLRRIAGSS